MNKLLIASLLTLTASFSKAQISGVTIFDDTFNLLNGATVINAGSPNYEVRWGTFSGGVFTPIGGNVAVPINDGYVGDPIPGFFELSATLTQASNTLVAIDTPLALAITLIPDGGVYASSATEAVLTDSQWLAPTFALSGNPVDFVFSASTTAVKGLFTFGGAGNDVINLQSTAIPEPSTYAALAGVAMLGAAAYRRRRSA